ncbi:stalk domain-containing protein [Lysinibacillus capsici]|uniref:stalk domain-containing protein n=1 Tax=Lysinibacillus capsici TaxID=2115968 RepID=UPI00289AFEF0|nr:stalk domain-containing protein [Lysinibacillus capsici]
MKKLFIITSYLGFFIVGGLTFTYFSTTEAASDLKKISVSQDPINYYVDKVEKVPPEGQAGFNYQGTIYVPMRFIVESLGEEVTWDGKTKSVYIGDVPKFIALKDVKPIGSDEDHFFHNPSSVIISTGEKFERSYQLGGYHGGGAVQDHAVEYLANGNYKGFETYLAPIKKLAANSFGAGFLKIYADGKLVFDSGAIKDKVKVHVNLDGVSKVKFELEGSGLGILNPKFIQ